MSTPDSNPSLSDDILSFYNHYNEAGRLFRKWNHLEFERTKEILKEFLPPAPQFVLDIGGGTGAYTFWLAEQGYDVHLIDPVPKHIEQAKETAIQQNHSASHFAVGDARQLNYADSSVDAVLLLGPLYHLVNYEDRIKALKEAYRVLKKGE